MDLINKLSKIVICGFTKEEIFQEYGNFKIRIGNNIILEPIIKEVTGIKIGVNDEDKVTDVSFTIREAIPFKELKSMFNEYNLGYNYYDGVSCLNFDLSTEVTVTARQDGYIDNTKISEFSFSEFELKKK